MKWLRIGWLSVAVTAACGGATAKTGTGTPGGSASVTGTINGQPVPANDAVATPLTTTTSGVTATSRTVVITSATNACPCGAAEGDSTLLELTVSVLGTTLPTETYSFPSSGNPTGDNPLAEAIYVVNDPGTTLLSATSGTITISQITASSTAGSFDVTFPTGDEVTGTFTAPTCTTTESADAACP